MFGENELTNKVKEQYADLYQYSVKVLLWCGGWVNDLPDWEYVDKEIKPLADSLLGEYKQAPYFGDLRLFLLNDPLGKRVNTGNTTDKPNPDMSKNLFKPNPYKLGGTKAEKTNNFKISL